MNQYGQLSEGNKMRLIIMLNRRRASRASLRRTVGSTYGNQKQSDWNLDADARQLGVEN